MNFRQEFITVQARHDACFCSHGRNYFACRRGRGIMLLRRTDLSPSRNLKLGTCAVSRYKLSRSQKTIKVQDFNYWQMRVSGCKSHYKAVLGARAKAKSVTSLLNIPSVLGAVVFSRTWETYLTTAVGQ